MKKYGVIVLFLLFTGCAVFIPMRVGPPEDLRVEITPERVEVGKKLAEGILACGSCHTSGGFAGEPRQDMYLAGDTWEMKLEGKIAVPNITRDKETGIGNWTDGELIRALTKGLNADGKQMLPVMPWPEMGVALTREEIYSLVAFLRTVPEPVKNDVGENDLSMMVSAVKATGMMYNMFTKSFAEYRPSTDTPVERGKRLAFLGACVDCHAYAPGIIPKFGEPLAGGLPLQRIGENPIVCSNLSPDEETGIGGFTDEELFESIRYGKLLRPRPDTEMVRWPMIARIPYHTSLSDEEINDLIAFFRSQDPIKHDIIKKAEKLSSK